MALTFDPKINRLIYYFDIQGHYDLDLVAPINNRGYLLAMTNHLVKYEKLINNRSSYQENEQKPFNIQSL